ncbi:hypothetical protein [Lysobacter sp. 1R34A]|uniref:hypothetical protein n=1 Tax=Lysobacter sp. 1R34A TaxID=3445786 RepID=UPI003EEB913E
MRLMPLAAILSIVFAAGCAAPDQAKDTVGADAPSTPAGDPGPAGRPMGKIGADQVGKVSPVPAFKGYGEHWGIDIQASGGMAHKVELTWGSGSERASGTVDYKGPPADAANSSIVLSGELATKAGAKPMVVEISRKDCTDDGDRPHAHSVQVTVEGLPPMRGCGDLAVY